MILNQYASFMKKIHSVIVILLLSMLIAEIPVIAESQLTTPSPSPKPSPSPPEYTARFVQSSLEVTIKNQPITAYLNTNISNPSLYYGFRFKDHNATSANWHDDPMYYFFGISSYGTYYKASVSDYTVVSFPSDNYPLKYTLNSGRIDLQVIALIGNEIPTNEQNGRVYAFDGVISGWSDVQTVTIPISSSSPTASPTVPEFTSWAIPLLLSLTAVFAGLLVYFRIRKVRL
jgi:hypothetical protein